MIICWKNKRSINYTGDMLALFVTFLDPWASLCNSKMFFFLDLVIHRFYYSIFVIEHNMMIHLKFV